MREKKKMMSNKEKFLSLVSNEETNTLARIQDRIANRDSMRITFDIALRILDQLDQLGWSQKRLAEELSVSPQQVNKWVRGKENFTIETLTKIGKTLNMSLIEVPHLTIEHQYNHWSSSSKAVVDPLGNAARYSLKKN